MNIKKLTISDFATSFGTLEDTFSSKCKTIINNSNFHYRELKLEELENLYLTILKRIELDKQKIGVKERTKVWLHARTRENFCAKFVPLVYKNRPYC